MNRIIKLFQDPPIAVEERIGERYLSPSLFNGSIFIKNGRDFEKVKLHDICYIKADGSYSLLCTSKKVYTLAMNLNAVLARINRIEFMRVHRSYAVNIDSVERIGSSSVGIGQECIPVTKKVREDLLKRVNTF